MNTNTINQITYDIRLTIPKLAQKPPLGELTNNIPYNQFIEKAQEINRLNIGNADQLNTDISTILKVDDHNMKGIALGCLTGIHTYNGNYKKAIACVNQAFNLKVDAEVYAYILTEYANLQRQLMRVDEALAVLDKALQLSTNEKLKWRIVTLQGYCHRYTNKELSLDFLHKACKYYLEQRELANYAIIRRQIAFFYVQNNETDKASLIFRDVQKLAYNYSFKSILWGVQSDLGWISILKKEFDKAKQIFLNLLKEDLILYSRCMVLQNIAYLEFEQGKYQESIEYQKKSFDLTKKYDIFEMLFEDYYKLGLAYEKNGKYQLAERYYREGYKQLQKEKNDLGIILLTGYRGELLDNYIRFISNKPSIKYVSRHPNTFSFTNDKTYREILEIFQEYLLTLHRNRTNTIREVCENLNISMRLYFIYQDRFSISKDKSAFKHIDNEHFNNYIHSLAQLEWKTAIKQFDSDLYCYLLKKYQYNKSKIADILDVTLLTVIKKTANL